MSVAADLEAFKDWLSGCGAEVLGTTSKWEVLRVTTSFGTLVAHRNKAGRQNWPDPLLSLYKQFQRGESPALSPMRGKRGHSKMRQRFAALAQRDGRACFYCGGRVPDPSATYDPDKAPTIEHLVAVAHGGPNHLSNCVLAHRGCNARAGSMSAAEKVRLREAMHGVRR